MKKFVLFLSILLLTSTVALATDTAATRLAIKKYKSHNYTGCISDTLAITRRDPSNAVAYYYLGMAYTQAGQKDKAVKAYSKVLSLNTNTVLASYAMHGKTCLETPDKCNTPEDISEIDKILAKPFGDGLSQKAKFEIQQKNLENVKNIMNKNGDVTNKQLQKFQDYSNSKSEKPTDKEIANAIDVLKRAGIQMNVGNEPTNKNSEYVEMAKAVSSNPQINEMNMWLGQGNNNSGNNNMMNMLPYMLAQNAEANKNGQKVQYSPQLIQSMMMSSMMKDFSFNSNNNSNNNY